MTEEEINNLPLAIKLQTSRHGVTFYQCLMECISMRELVEQFDRLYECNLLRKGHPINIMAEEATGKMKDDMKKFVDFCWKYVFLTLEASHEAHPRMGVGDKDIRWH